MNRFILGAAGAGILAATTLGLAVPAAAAPLGGSNASEVVNALRAKGYDVQINGDQSASLSACTVTDVSGLSSASKGTVYVGVSCNDDHDE